jgi:hypothetical protein
MIAPKFRSMKSRKRCSKYISTIAQAITSAGLLTGSAVRRYPVRRGWRDGERVIATFGWSSPAQAMVYIRNADRKRMAAEAAAKLAKSRMEVPKSQVRGCTAAYPCRVA